MGIDLVGLIKKFQPRPLDVVGVDIGTTGIKIVRLKKTASGPTLIGADIFPTISFDKTPEPLQLPNQLKGRYVSIAISSKEAVIKLLNFQGISSDEIDTKIVESLGLKNPENYRISYTTLSEVKSKGEISILAVALPNAIANIALSLFPTGLPAPYSLEVSQLATLTALLNGPLKDKESTGVIDFSTEISLFTLFNKGQLVLLRTFDIGWKSLVEKVQQNLGVDVETASGIITDGAFDISQPVNQLITPMIRQMIVARDFVERRWNCQIKQLYVSGSLACSRDCIENIRKGLNVEVSLANPLEAINIPSGALQESLKGKEWRLSAAIGCALATLEESQ